MKKPIATVEIDGGKAERILSAIVSRLRDLSPYPGDNSYVRGAIELLKRSGFNPAPGEGSKAAKAWFHGLDDKHRLGALHRLVGGTLIREDAAAKKVAFVLRQVGARYAHGKFVQHGRKLEEYETVFHTYAQGSNIGQGGTGTVFEVTDEEGKPWALKVLSEADATTTRRKRFANELWFCAHHTHPNWLPVLDWGLTTVEGRPFYVMPRYQGNLRDVLKQSITPAKALAFFEQMLDGVEGAHAKGVWHRDLKPENFLCDAKRDALVVADFGIAHFHADVLRAGVQTKKGDRLANRDYAAPEQRRKGATVDGRADIYALGLILNEMFTGELPLGTGYKRIGAVAPDYAYLDRLVGRMIQGSPAKRPTLAAIRQGLTPSQSSPLARAARPRKSRRDAQGVPA
jgi:serine/threonine protein kinase